MTLLAGGTGFGPILRESKSRVLPLDHPPERSSFDQSVRNRPVREPAIRNHGIPGSTLGDGWGSNPQPLGPQPRALPIEPPPP